MTILNTGSLKKLREDRAAGLMPKNMLRKLHVAKDYLTRLCITLDAALMEKQAKITEAAMPSTVLTQLNRYQMFLFCMSPFACGNGQ